MADSQETSTSPETPTSTPVPAPVATPGGGSNFIKRELNGATFLTLEHIAHMALVVAVPLLLAAGIGQLIAMWSGQVAVVDLPLLSGALSQVQAVSALGVAAALLVLAPALVVLDRRTRAEWQKRHGYSARVAYKVPVYTALGLLATVKVGFVVAMLSVVLTSLAMIGVPNSNTGQMYLTQFLPALLGALVVSGAGWYVFKLAKGRDIGRQFSMLLASLSVVAVIALFTTSFGVIHSNSTPSQLYPTDTPSSLEDIFNY